MLLMSAGTYLRTWDLPGWDLPKAPRRSQVHHSNAGGSVVQLKLCDPSSCKSVQKIHDSSSIYYILNTLLNEKEKPVQD